MGEHLGYVVVTRTEPDGLPHIAYGQLLPALEQATTMRKLARDVGLLGKTQQTEVIAEVIALDDKEATGE